MPSLQVVVPLLTFAVLGAAIVVLLWRATTVARTLRQESDFSRLATELIRRADASLTELATAVDGLRRRQTPPDAVGPKLALARDEIQAFGLEADGLDVTPLQAAMRAGILDDLERAARAMELVEHGQVLLAGGRFERQPEGETSVKRGYLNLLHAREALRLRADEIAREGTPATPRLLSRRRFD